jgi:ParB-like chromosome segregation protein Spo0J
MIREATSDPYILTLVENLQRADLTPAEESAGLVELMRRHGWTTRQVAAAIKRSQSYVSKRLRIFEDAALRRAVLEQGLATSTAEELLTVESSRRVALIKRAVAEGWGVAEVRAATRKHAKAAGDRAPGNSQRRVAGLAMAIQQVRAILRRAFPHELSDADRRDLRLLFLDLARIAQAQPGRQKPVIPQLPNKKSLRAS